MGNLNWNGLTSFVFNVRTPYYTSTNSLTVSVNVAPVNDPPVANSNSFTFNAETDYIIQLTGNDVDSTVFTYTITVLPTSGTLKNCLAADCASTQDVVINTPYSTSYFVYNGGYLYYGSNSFDFFMKDDSGDSSNVATISLNVLRVDHPPTGADGYINATYPSNGTVVTFYVADVDTPLANVQVIVLSNDFPGSLYQMDGTPITAASTTVTSSNFSVLYVPVKNINIDKSAPVGGIKYWLYDGEKYADVSYTVLLYVNNANLPPVPTVRTASGIEDQDIVIQFNATDDDSAVKTYVFTITQVPAKGKLYQFDNVTLITNGATVTDSQFRVTYRADPYGYGSNYDRFYYSVTNSYDSLTSDAVYLDITIAHVNHQPVASIAVEPVCDENGFVTFALTGNALLENSLTLCRI